MPFLRIAAPLLAALMLALSLMTATASAALGDGTYQWWWGTNGCTWDRTDEGGGIYTQGRVRGSYLLNTQVVGGNNIRRIYLDAMMVGKDSNGRWVQIDGTKKSLVVDGTVLSGKNTQRIYFRWTADAIVSDISTMPDEVAMVYKLKYRRYYGKDWGGFWKTKKQSKDIYPDSVVRMAGQQVLGDTKNYLYHQTCRNFVNDRATRAASTGEAGFALRDGVFVTAAPAPPRETREATRTTDEQSESSFAGLTTFGIGGGAFAPGAWAGPERSFEALSAGEAATAAGDAASPPGPSIAVGHDRALVSAAGALDVIDLESGARIGPASSILAPWQAAGGPCAAPASVSPRSAVLYDERADRFAVARAIPAPAGEDARVCLAVSKTNDPAGAWNTSSAVVGAGLSLEDIRLAAWTNSYLATVSDAGATAADDVETAPTPASMAPRLVAFERSAALAGSVPQTVTRRIGDGALIDAAAADLDADLPDPGAPALIVGSGYDKESIYRFDLDWADPSAAALRDPVAVEGAVEGCGLPCLSQPEAPDSLDDSAQRIGTRPVVHLDAEGAPRLAYAISGSVSGYTDLASPFADAVQGSFTSISPYGEDTAFEPSIAADSGGGLIVAHHGTSNVDEPGLRYEAIAADGTSQGSSSATPPGAASTTDSTFGPDTAAATDPDDGCRIWIAGRHQRSQQPGDWTVRLAAVRGAGCATEPDRAPEAVFSANPPHGSADLDVAFDGAGSSDPESGVLTYAWSFGDGATSTGVAPSHVFTADGTYRVRLVVTDPAGHTATMTRIIEVADTDVPPVAGTDQISTKVGVDASRNVVRDEVSTSDFDPDGGAVTVTGASDPAHGSIQCADSGDCVYTPDAGYSGADQFTYTLVDDEANQVTGKVFVEVVNRAPLADDDGLEAGSGTPAMVDPLENDNDLDLTDEIEFKSNTQPAHGSVVCDGFQCTYTSNANYVGVDRFDYTITDGELDTTSFVDIVVAPCPDLTNAIGNGSNLIQGWEWEICASPDAHSETTISAAGMDRTGPAALMTSGLSDLAAPPNTDTGVGANLGTAARGANDVSVLRLDLKVPTGATCLGFDAVFASEEYPEYVGSPYNDAFIAELDQSTWAVSGQTITAPDNFAKDSAGKLLSVNSVLFGTVVTANGTEYDGATPPIRIQRSITPGDHSLYLSIFDASDHILDSAVFIDNLLAGADPSGGCVTGVNAKPKAGADSKSTLEDTATVIDVLANDSDPDGNLVPSTLKIATQPSSGSASVANGKVTFTPAANASGTFSFTYEVCDDGGACDTATVTVTVVAVNDPPTAAFTATNDVVPRKVSFDASASADPESPISAYEWDFGDGSTGAGVTTSHTYSSGGGYVVKLVVRDPQNASGETSKSVNAGAPPVATDDGATTAEDTPIDVDVLVNDTDADGDTLTVTGTATPSRGVATVLLNQKIRYTPAANAHGTFTVPYTVSDGHGGTDTGLLTITVAPVNDAPVAVDNAASTDDKTPVSVDVVANDTDVDGDTLTLDAIGTPSGGTAAVDAGKLRFTAPSGSAGTYTITYTVGDGHGASDQGLLTVTVTASNHAPVAADDSATTSDDTPVTVDVLANDSDPDGDPLTITGISANAVVQDQKVRFTPTASGVFVVAYSVGDGHGGIDEGKLVVSVTPAQQPFNFLPKPSFTVTPASGVAALTVHVDASGSSDPEGGSLSYGWSFGDGGTATGVTADHTYTQPGNRTIMLTVTDPAGGSAVKTLVVRVAKKPKHDKVKGDLKRNGKSIWTFNAEVASGDFDVKTNKKGKVIGMSGKVELSTTAWITLTARKDRDGDVSGKLKLVDTTAELSGKLKVVGLSKTSSGVLVRAKKTSGRGKKKVVTKFELLLRADEHPVG